MVGSMVVVWVGLMAVVMAAMMAGRWDEKMVEKLEKMLAGTWAAQ